jgi:hypothetical protein
MVLFAVVRLAIINFLDRNSSVSLTIIYVLPVVLKVLVRNSNVKAVLVMQSLEIINAIVMLAIFKPNLIIHAINVICVKHASICGQDTPIALAALRMLALFIMIGTIMIGTIMVIFMNAYVMMDFMI